MDTQAARLAVIEALPEGMRDRALVDWPTVAVLLGYKDLEQARKKVRDAKVPLVRLSERRELPMWGDLRRHLESLRAEYAAVTA